MIKNTTRIPCSFRDSAGQVFSEGDRIIRVLSEEGRRRIEHQDVSKFLSGLVSQERLVEFKAVSIPPAVSFPKPSCAFDLKKIPFVSYACEWPFSLLRRAALFHLDLQIDALAAGVMIIDASTRNIQFVGQRPIFIDHLSFSPIDSNYAWNAHHQFVSEFLIPLLINSKNGMPFNGITRGIANGICPKSGLKLLPYFSRFSPLVAKHVFLPALLGGERATSDKVTDIGRAALTKKSLLSLLLSLRDGIEALQPRWSSSTWDNYNEVRSYSAADLGQKKSTVAKFVKLLGESTLVDIGSFQGEFSQVALEAGAKYVVGLEADPPAVDRAVAEQKVRADNFLPLVADISSPTPGAGWRNADVTPLLERLEGSSVISLALIHHLVFAENIPLPDVVDLFISTFPIGLIEFVPSADPMVDRIRGIADHPEYNEANFCKLLSDKAKIEFAVKLPDCGRTLYAYTVE